MLDLMSNILFEKYNFSKNVAIDRGESAQYGFIVLFFCWGDFIWMMTSENPDMVGQSG